MTSCPGYHLNKRHWNTVMCSGAVVSDEMIRDMVEDSYDLIVAAMPRARAGAAGLDGELGAVTSPDTTQIEANLELVRRMIDAFNRRDMEAMLEQADENFEYDWSRSLGLYADVYRGPEGFKRFVDEQWSMFDDFRVEAHELIPLRESRGRALRGARPRPRRRAGERELNAPLHVRGGPDRADHAVSGAGGGAGGRRLSGSPSPSDDLLLVRQERSPPPRPVASKRKRAESRRWDSNPRPPLYEGDLGPGTEDA